MNYAEDGLCSSNSVSFVYENIIVASEVLLRSRETASTIPSLSVKPVISLNGVLSPL